MYQTHNQMQKFESSSNRSHPTNTSSNCCLSKPFIVGYMSVDGMRQYHSDLSQLKFLNKIPNESFRFDLNHNINVAIKRTTDNNNERITILLQYLVDHCTRIMCQISKPSFISYRRTLISIMCSAYGVNEPLQIAATLFNGSIYLCSLDTDKEITKQTQSYHQEKFCAWGYKFEQYMLSDSPKNPINIQKPVVENEEFSLYYVANLGENLLLYGAQVDGMLSTNNMIHSPPDTTDVDINLKYLRKNSFIELKTNRNVENSKQERNFRRYKLMRCWCQCYLADLKGLIVGYRNDIGIIENLQWFETHEIASYCKDVWNPQTLVDYLDYILSYIKKCFEYHNHPSPITLQFNLSTSGSIHVEKLDSEIFLPKWYIEKINLINSKLI